ncbi:hypothetical protein FPQ18DRAFT_301570 [Pyronema domesticum]|nr:hypothetical protein FPQ18DRAFT_301570 [Pyronema domesticum]
MPDTIDSNTTTTNTDNGDGTPTTGTTGAEETRALRMMMTMERDTIYNVDHGPRNADDTLSPANEATVPSLSLARHSPTALARTPLSGRKRVAATSLEVVDKYDQMSEVARKLTDAVCDVRKGRDQMVESIMVLEQQLKDQEIEFENRERQ